MSVRIVRDADPPALQALPPTSMVPAPRVVTAVDVAVVAAQVTAGDIGWVVQVVPVGLPGANDEAFFDGPGFGFGRGGHFGL